MLGDPELKQAIAEVRKEQPAANVLTNRGLDWFLDCCLVWCDVSSKQQVAGSASSHLRLRNPRPQTTVDYFVPATSLDFAV